MLSNQHSLQLNTNDSYFCCNPNNTSNYKKDTSILKGPKTGFYNDDRQPGYNYLQYKYESNIGAQPSHYATLNKEFTYAHKNSEKLDFNARSLSKKS